jgi:hypothetical protein
MRLRVLLIALLISLITIDVSHAKNSGDEIREQKALFILDDFQQALELQYQYQESASGSRSGSSHGFQESYRGNLELTVLNPHLLKTKLDFSLGLDQSLSYRSGGDSAFGNAYRYNYQFNASGLDRSVTPFTVNSYKATATVITPFAPTFTSDTTGNELRVQLRNTLLPSSFGFSRITMDNHGGSNTSSSVSTAFDYSVTHNYKDFSSSGLSFSASEATGSFAGSAPQTTRAYSSHLNNQLRWGQGKYTLFSAAQIYDQMNQNIPQRSISLSETFHDQLGKALELQVSYAFSKNSTVDFEGQTSENIANGAEVALKHRLFESLMTSLTGRVSKTEVSGGVEYLYSGTGALSYVKRLPDHNTLTLSAVGTHTLDDNQLSRSTLSTFNQPHPGVHQGDTIELPVTGTLKSVDSVKAGVLVFTELSDYTVDLVRGTISIVRGGRIDADGTGSDLQISYTESVSPKSKFVADSYGLSGATTFGAGKYQLGGSYQSQSMTLVQGSSSQSALRESSSKRVFLTANLEKLNYRVSYSDSQVGDLESQSVEGSASYSMDLGRGSLMLAGSENYSWNGGSDTAPGFSENTLTCSAVLVRNSFLSGRLLVSANALDARNDLRGTRDIFSLRSSWLYARNSFSVSLDGQTAWTFAEGVVTRNNSLTVSLRRSF